ncbi:hypothetical protein, unknown function [Leishmania donovani]|uniref:Integral membrane protein n=2 Tax=Leishmania donovani TaxID=5661 RepID=E9BMX7_LEIDO|nr:hypothetical protein, unknown function [Leishmania donovani]CBZ36605.1 hypothetical protein, unknown function [Leishmania donovani]
MGFIRAFFCFFFTLIRHLSCLSSSWATASESACTGLVPRSTLRRHRDASLRPRQVAPPPRRKVSGTDTSEPQRSELENEEKSAVVLLSRSEAVASLPRLFVLFCFLSCSMECINQENASARSATNVARGVDEPTVATVPFSPLQVELQRSDPLSRSLCEPVQRSQSSASNAAEANDTDVPPLLGGDPAAARSSSIISSHDASFYSSLMVSRAENLDALESCTSRTGCNLISPSTGAAAERYAHEQSPSAEPRLSTPGPRLAPNSADSHGGKEEVAPNAEAEIASEQPVSSGAAVRTVESGVAATGPHSVGAEDHSSGSQAHAHKCLASPVGNVKTLEELLDWRSHLSAWKQSVGAHESHNTDGNDNTVKHMCNDQASEGNMVGRVNRKGAPASEGSQVSSRSECLQGCHGGCHRTPAASSSSPSTDAITPAESNAAGGDTIAVTHNPQSQHSHPSSGAASQTEVVDTFFTKESSSASSSHPRSPAQVDGHPWSTQLNAHLEQHLSTGENLATQAPPTAHVTIIDGRVLREGGGTGKSGRPRGAGPPTLSSSRCLEVTGLEDHHPPSSTGHSSPYSHPALTHGVERRPWVRSALPPSAHTPILLHSSPVGGFDGCRSRDNWNNPHSGSNKSTISSAGIQRQHSREESLSQATPRTPESWRHKVKAMPPMVKPLRELAMEEEYPVFAVPVDEETNKAVVAFVSGFVLLICLVFICAM